MRLTKKQLKEYREKFSLSQDNKCSLCNVDLSTVVSCLDHDHGTGQIRSVLCLNCNGIEGKVYNLARRAKRERTPADFIKSLLKYWENWEMYPRGLLHPKHKTEEEKRESRNKKARLRNKKKKSA